MLSDEQDGGSMVYWLKIFIAGTVVLHLATSFLISEVVRSLALTLELRDVEAFVAWLPWVLVFIPKITADLVARAAKWNFRKRLRQCAVRRLCQALLADEEPDAHVLYRLHFIESTSTPEHQITEDNRVFGDHIDGALMPALGHMVSLLLSARQLLAANRGFFLRSLAVMPISAAVNLAVAKIALSRPVRDVESTGATLRAFLGRVRSNVESVAFFDGGASELQRFTGAHSAIVRAKEQISGGLALTAGVNEMLSYVLLLVPGWDLLKQVVRNEVTVSEALTAYYLMQGLAGTALAILLLPQVLVQAGVSASRMLQLLSEADSLRASARNRRCWSEAGYEKVLAVQRRGADAAGPLLELRDVSLWTPALPGRPLQVLMEGLSLDLQPGESLLVAGETGAGKTALLAAIHGLWNSGRGRVSRCGDAAVFCVPQQPYTFQGSLREQLLYPYPERQGVSDEELQGALEQVNLLCDLKAFHLDDVCPWGDMLSLGQQQRIGVARALLVKGLRLVLLDDCTSALDIKNERQVYLAVSKRAQCYVSTGHRPALRRYHTHTLSLQPDAPSAWRLAPTVLAHAGGPNVSAAAAAGGSIQGGTPASAVGSAGVAASAAAVREALRSPVAEAGRQFAVTPQAGNEAIGERGASRSRGQLAVADPRALLQCILEVAWPILSARNVVGRFIRLSIVAGISVAFVAAVTAHAISSVGDLLSMLKSGDLDGVQAFILRNLWIVPVKGVLVMSTTYSLVALSSFVTENIRLGIARRYLSCGSAGLYLLHTAGGAESPSEQIAEICGFDCDQFGQFGMGVALGLVAMLAGIVGSFVSLWQLAPELFRVVFALLLVFVLAVERQLVRPSMRIFMTFLERNTALRTSIAHAYTHSHSVAFLRGGSAELRRCVAMAKTALDASFSYLYLNAVLSGLDDMLDFFMQMLSLGWGARDVLNGTTPYVEYASLDMRLQGVSKVVREFLKLLCMTTPIFSLSKRLQTFVRAVDEAKVAGSIRGEGIEVVEPKGPMALELRSLALRTPKTALGFASLPILHGVSAQLPEGAGLLIAGESGLGKSSLLRAISGLWSNGEGAVARPGGGATFFIPQRPYLCLGSLREQLLYPSAKADGAPCDAELRSALRAVGLDHLLQSPGLEVEDLTRPDAGLDAVQAAMHWTGQLSQGEVQRVSFARVLLRKGLRLVLLDEGTAAMDMTHEAEMYRLLGLHVPSYASVAHRPQLRRFHSHVLHLERTSDAATSRFLPMADYERELSEAAIGA